MKWISGLPVPQRSPSAAALGSTRQVREEKVPDGLTSRTANAPPRLRKKPDYSEWMRSSTHKLADRLALGQSVVHWNALSCFDRCPRDDIRSAEPASATNRRTDSHRFSLFACLPPPLVTLRRGARVGCGGWQKSFRERDVSHPFIGAGDRVLHHYPRYPAERDRPGSEDSCR